MSINNKIPPRILRLEKLHKTQGTNVYDMTDTKQNREILFCFGYKVAVNLGNKKAKYNEGNKIIINNNDAIQNGILGLMEAIENWMGHTPLYRSAYPNFETFAHALINKYVKLLYSKHSLSLTHPVNDISEVRTTTTVTSIDNQDFGGIESSLFDAKFITEDFGIQIDKNESLNCLLNSVKGVISNDEYRLLIHYFDSSLCNNELQQVYGLNDIAGRVCSIMKKLRRTFKGQKMEDFKDKVLQVC